MIRPAIFLLLTLSFASSARAACEGQSLGAGVTLSEATAVAAILDAPETWVGREVRVEGKVHEVCEMAGCWMELEAADAGRVLKVKVKDGDIVFPVSARGKQAVAQGKVERLEMSRARYVRHLKHLAEEQDRAFDESSVVGEGPFLVYQVAGTGAQICG